MKSGWVGLTVLAGACLMSALTWSVYTLFAVEAAARNIARDEPYCLQVTGSRFDQRTATRHLDLWGFNLIVPKTSAGGSEEYQWTFHAVLVVGDGPVQLYNWSHRAQDFAAISEQAEKLIPVSVVCEPSVDFIERLSLP